MRTLNQHLRLRIEQTHLGHINSERHGLADRGRSIRLEAGDDLAAADAHDRDGLGAGRLDDFDRGLDRAEIGLFFRPPTIVADQVFRPDAQHHATTLAGGSDDLVGKRQAHRLPFAFRKHHRGRARNGNLGGQKIHGR